MKESWRIGFLLGCAFFLSAGGWAPLPAATYHVATNGSDSAGNGSETYP
jgi:hypothetical protein